MPDLPFLFNGGQICAVIRGFNLCLQLSKSVPVGRNFVFETVNFCKKFPKSKPVLNFEIYEQIFMFNLSTKLGIIL